MSFFFLFKSNTPKVKIRVETLGVLENNQADQSGWYDSCLAMFWVAVNKDLKPFRPVRK